MKFAKSVIQSAILFTFHNKVVGETFSTCLVSGKAAYPIFIEPSFNYCDALQICKYWKT